MSERQVRNAAIFRRGQKKELFDDRQQEDDSWDETLELREKLGDLHALWATARTGCGLDTIVPACPGMRDGVAGRAWCLHPTQEGPSGGDMEAG